MKERLLAITHLPDNRVLILPQTCEKIYEQDVRDEALEARFNPGFNVVFTGNISPAQSFETVLSAAVKLKRKGISDINWIIVGDGMSRKWLESEVAKLGLEDSFYFEGYKPITEMPKYNTLADILLGCLVKSELLEATVPAKVMSYIAAGRPMVLAMDGEVRELINEEIGCGLVGPTGDSEELAANIEKIYRMPKSERQAMGARGRAYHFKHFERNQNLVKLRDFIFS
jgi:glycosyltransferase involved in cell wall biosynthesis